eukprot:1683852-Amphidinium_carterae.2
MQWHVRKVACLGANYMRNIRDASVHVKHLAHHWWQPTVQVLSSPSALTEPKKSQISQDAHQSIQRDLQSDQYELESKGQSNE